MKITKSTLKQIIKEEIMEAVRPVRSASGQMVPGYETSIPTGSPAKEVGVSPNMFDVTRLAEEDTAEVLEAVKELLDLQYGENQYDLSAKLKYLSDRAGKQDVASKMDISDDPGITLNPNPDAWAMKRKLGIGKE